MVSRDAVLQGLLALFEAPRYLEIGVAHGTTFHRVQARRKVAVDPSFRFDVAAAREENPSAAYHEVRSDTYFGEIVGPDEQFDVINIDGMHTAEQALRDLLNALSCLAPGGLIVIDDVKPSSHLAAMPDPVRFMRVKKSLGSTERNWMGDVYRVVYFIDSFLQQLSWRTVAENHGQTILWRRRRPQVTERGIAAVAAKSFDDLMLEQAVLRPAPYQTILEEVRRDAPRPAGVA